jgi:hypothetical protein
MFHVYHVCYVVGSHQSILISGEPIYRLPEGMISRMYDLPDSYLERYVRLLMTSFQPRLTSGFMNRYGTHDHSLIHRVFKSVSNELGERFTCGDYTSDVGFDLTFRMNSRNISDCLPVIRGVERIPAMLWLIPLLHDKKSLPVDLLRVLWTYV